MGWLEIFVLAIVQGLTEFLPVSSSGHLVVANALLERLGMPPAQDLVEVSIALHLGTLASVLVYYRREIARLLGADRRVVPLLVVGTVPAAIVGVGLKKGLPDATSDAVLESVVVAGLMFPVTALILIAATRFSGSSGEAYQQLGYGKALAIGVGQAFAILPGVSRSGTTIAAGLAAGLDRQSASTFAFLLAIPAILGAGVLETLDALKEGTTGTPIDRLAVGFVVSFVVGWAALAVLIEFVKRGRLALFAGTSSRWASPCWLGGCSAKGRSTPPSWRGDSAWPTGPTTSCSTSAPAAGWNASASWCSTAPARRRQTSPRLAPQHGVRPRLGTTAPRCRRRVASTRDPVRRVPRAACRGDLRALRHADAGRPGRPVPGTARELAVDRRPRSSAGRRPTRPTPGVLNLFAYTGGSTLAAAAAGGEVTHVDASKPSVALARQNAERSGLAAAPVRWIVEDALRYCEREVKRGSRYDAVVLDPPTYGHGPKGEEWRLERDLPRAARAVRDARRSRAGLLPRNLPHAGRRRGRAVRVPVRRGRGPLRPAPSERPPVAQDRVAMGRRLESGVWARWPAVGLNLWGSSCALQTT